MEILYEGGFYITGHDSCWNNVELRELNKKAKFSPILVKVGSKQYLY